MSRTIAVILAGGRGTRLGGIRKADLRIGGERLLQRVVSVLDGRVDHLLIASGRSSLLALPSKATAIEDESPESQGPLAGIRAAMAHIGEAFDGDTLVSVAVDTPFLPENYVARLRDSVGSAGAAYAAWGEGFYPTNAAWKVSQLRAALSKAAPEAGPKAILNLLGATRVDWCDEASANPFANINTLADLLTLQRRALALR